SHATRGRLPDPRGRARDRHPRALRRRRVRRDPAADRRRAGQGARGEAAAAGGRAHLPAGGGHQRAARGVARARDLSDRGELEGGADPARRQAHVRGQGDAEGGAMIESAGTLLYRRNGDRLEVLIVHPWGPYNRRAPWSIPKGRTNPGEDLARSRKRIYGFAGPAPEDAMPRSDQTEVDEAKFVPIDRARFLLHPAQVTFLDRLLATIDLEAAVWDPSLGSE